MKRSLTLLAGLLVLAALPGCDPLGQMRREEAELKAEAERQRAEDAAKRLEAEKREQQAKIDSLTEQKNSTPDEVTRRALTKQIEIERARKPGPAGTGKAACNCTPGDPLCSCR